MAVCGRIALFSFVSSLTSLLLISMIKLTVNFGHNIINDWFAIIFVSHALITHAILGLRFYFRSNLYFQVSFRASLLGNGLALGVLLSLLGTTDWSTSFGLYLVVLSSFHFSEYMVTSVINPHSLSLDSFLLNHSKEYGLAAAAAFLEFTIESYLWPQMKSNFWIIISGLSLCLIGELLRKGAMLTARSNFNHIVQHRRQDGHVLVTHGIYAFCRHPSYVGWFYWSIGTQIILMNPICCVGYAVMSWLFFRDRIYHEEITLLNFFGDEYLKYKQRVGTGLPFITGYRFQL